MAVASHAGHRRAWWASMRVSLRRTAVRIGVLAAVAVGLANLHLPWRPETLCALRQWTGLPCPLCGTTTAAVHVGHLDIVGGLAANPFTVIVIGLIATSPLTGVGRWWDERLTNRRRAVICVALFAVAELWQLHRFGLVP